MDAASTHSLDTPSAGRGAFSHPERPFRNFEPTRARLPLPNIVDHLAVSAHAKRPNTASGTWTSSSGDVADISDADYLEARDEFVQEYNRVARKHGIRTLASSRRTPSLPGQSPSQQRRGWFSRTFLRQVSATTSDASSTKSGGKVKNKRSVSDLALQLMNGAKKDSLKDEDLQSLVRLCGKSKLYLPSEYSPNSLVLPTCLRATAQYLVEHGAETRGVFRIPGSVRIVNSLYSYYCADGDANEISSTISCPNLPSHIKAGAHDVASTFKRLLSGLPGGILGSVPLLDALVAVHSQLKGKPEFLKTKQTKLRARLIALAIGTVESQLRRDLICAVFGLLSLIARAAEKAPREDEHGRPLPTSDLMGSNALGIVFGPLLVGGLLDSYTMHVATLASGSELFPVTPPNLRKERRRSKVSEDAHRPSFAVDKVYMANDVTEMLITHWREVVKHMRSLGVSRPSQYGPRLSAGLRSSVSEGFALRAPHPDSHVFEPSDSPVPPRPTPESVRSAQTNLRPPLVLPRRRPRGMRPLSSSLAVVEASLLSPPVEEPSPAAFERLQDLNGIENRQSYYPLGGNYVTSGDKSHGDLQKSSSPPKFPNRGTAGSKSFLKSSHDTITIVSQRMRRTQLDPQEIRPSCSRPSTDAGSPVTPVTLNRWRIAEPRPSTASRRPANPFKFKRAIKDTVAPNPTQRGQNSSELPKISTQRISQDMPRSKVSGPFEENALRNDRSRTNVFGLGRSRLSTWRGRRRSLVSTDTGSPVSPPLGLREVGWGATEAGSPRGLPQSQRNSGSRQSSHRGGGSLGNCIGKTTARGDISTRLDSQFSDRGSPHGNAKSTEASGFVELSRPLQVLSGNTMAQKRSHERLDLLDGPGVSGENQSPHKRTEPLRPETPRDFPLGPRPDPGRPLTGTIPQSRPTKLTGSAVKAMAAMFEVTSKDSKFLSPSAEEVVIRVDSKPRGMISPYTVNLSPSKSPRPTELILPDQHTWLSTLRDRRSRESGVRGEVARSSIPIPSRVEKTLKLWSPGRTHAPKQPGTSPSGQDTELYPSPKETLAREMLDITEDAERRSAAVSSTRTPEPRHGPTTPSPYLKSSNGWSKSPLSEASPASTIRRFPLISTPEQRQRIASASAVPSPAAVAEEEEDISKAPGRTSSAVNEESSNGLSRIDQTQSHLPLHPHGHEQDEKLKNQLRGGSKVNDHLRNHELGRGHGHEYQDTRTGGGGAAGANTTKGVVASGVDADADAGANAGAGANAEVAAVRAQLHLAKHECAVWRARAERAERRVRMLEGN